MLFALLFRRRAVKPSRRNRPRKKFESLEKRYVLSSAPMIDYFEASVGSGQTVNVSGHVSDFDPNAGALSVALSGPLTANVSVDSGGNFSYSGSASSLSTLEAVASDAGTGLSSDAATTTIANDAPSLWFSVMPTGDGKNVQISGMVQDESPGGLSVSFSGVVSGSVTTDSSGNFSLETTASALGNVAATTSDAWGVSSSEADSTLSSDPPTVSFWSEPTGSNQEITVYGQVTAGVPNGATVTISGVASGTATADSYGNFSLTADASGEGSLSASATDVWGQTSSTSTTTVLGSVPSIGSLNAVPIYNQSNQFVAWELTGEIYDFAGTFTLNISGIYSGESSVTTTAQDDTFTISIPLPENANGQLTVVATNSWGESSGPAYAYVWSM
jgi:hypothetical protein